MGGAATVLSTIYLYLLRWIAKPVIYTSIVMIFCLLVGGGFYVLFEGLTYDDSDHTKDVMIGMAIMIWIISFLYAVLILCSWKSIKLATAIMEAASDFVRQTPKVMMVPSIFLFFFGGFMVWWVISAVWLYSVGDIYKSSNSPFAEVHWNETTRYLWIYHIVGMFWISSFITGCG